MKGLFYSLLSVALLAVAPLLLADSPPSTTQAASNYRDQLIAEIKADFDLSVAPTTQQQRRAVLTVDNKMISVATLSDDGVLITSCVMGAEAAADVMISAGGTAQ